MLARRHAPMKLPNGLGELTYCTNIHPGESLEEVRSNLEQHARRVRERVSPSEPFGLGLRLSARAARALREPAALAGFADFLCDQGFYVFTVNGFPYGPFHGTPVKERVYEPDWSEPSRLEYTRDLAFVLAELLATGTSGSISTLPGCFRPQASPGRVDAIVEQLLQAAAFLAALERKSGKLIALALEPEPHCLFETTREAVAFLEERLFPKAALARFSDLANIEPLASESILRRHLGLCVDTCHAAVEFEDVEQSLHLCRRAGIGIKKLQLSAGLRLRSGTESARQALQRFTDPVYLHQVVVRAGGRELRLLDMPEALGRSSVDPAEEWRVHFHVPLFLPSFGELESTRDQTTRWLELQRQEPFTSHLEVETYTWDVLPESYRNEPVDGAIARELEWAKKQLTAIAARPPP